MDMVTSNLDIVIPFAEVLLAALVHATLQLGLGALLLLYHSSLGKHIQRKTRNVVDSYIAGAGTMVFILLAAMVFILACYFGKPLFADELVIVIIMLLAVAVAVWAIYYRRRRSTELWLPRTVARFIDKRAKETNSNTEAFSLGMLTSLAEMPFTLVLVIVAGNSLLILPPTQQMLAVALYTIIAILPMIVMRVVIKHGNTVADIQRWRVKERGFLKMITIVGMIVLAVFMFAFEVMG